MKQLLTKGGIIMKLNKSILLIPIFLVLLFFLIGCDGLTPLPIPVTGVNITAGDSIQIEIGGPYILVIAEVEPLFADNTDVTWSSSNPLIATVSSGGLITGGSVGVTTITVTTDDGGFTDSIEVECVELTPLPISVTGVNITQDGPLGVIAGGTPLQLSAEVEPPYADNIGVTWSSSKPLIATVSGDGLVTGLRNGLTTITVTTDDGGFTDSVQVQVTVIY